MTPQQEPERSIVDWELSDLNGDGYPDFVFNSRPAEFVITGFGAPIEQAGGIVVGKARRLLQLRPGAGVRVAYNSVGVRFDHDEGYAFSRSVALGVEGTEWGVGAWVGEDVEGTRQRQFAGFADINGDGLAERIVGSRAYLGAYVGTGASHLNQYITLPGNLAEQENNRSSQCDDNVHFHSWTRQSIRDVNGDGIPDHVGDHMGGGAALGTGAGFAARIPVSANFMISHQTESCDGKVSNTDGGLFDIDGDGLPEVVGLTADPKYKVSGSF